MGSYTAQELLAVSCDELHTLSSAGLAAGITPVLCHTEALFLPRHRDLPRQFLQRSIDTVLGVRKRRCCGSKIPLSYIRKLYNARCASAGQKSPMCTGWTLKDRNLASCAPTAVRAAQTAAC